MAAAAVGCCRLNGLDPSKVLDGAALCPASGGAEGEHPLQIPRHGHKAPLAADRLQTPQQELPEAPPRLDDAEYWFWNLLAQCIQCLAVRRLQPVRHGLHR